MIGRKLAQYHLINANVFSAMQSRLANRSSEALAAEERQDKANGLTNIAALMRANTVRVSDRIENTSDSVAVIFNDPKTDEHVTLNLSKENLERLKGQFGKDNFYTRSDGAIRLNGKAEAFVSGWFGDVAYQQNLAGADKDGSGRVSGEEWREVKTFLVDAVLDATSLTETSVETYIPLENYASTHSFQTIEDGLNTFIEMDKDFDGHIQRIGEMYEGGTRELVAEIDTILDEQERNALAKMTPNIFDNGNPLDANKPMTNKEWKKKLEKLKEMQEELDAQFAEMAEKLKEQLKENGDVKVAFENRGIESGAMGEDTALAHESQSPTNKATDSAIDLEQLAPVVEEIASKVASNDVRLFETRA